VRGRPSSCSDTRSTIDVKRIARRDTQAATSSPNSLEHAGIGALRRLRREAPRSEEPLLNRDGTVPPRLVVLHDQLRRSDRAVKLSLRKEYELARHATGRRRGRPMPGGGEALARIQLAPISVLPQPRPARANQKASQPARGRIWFCLALQSQMLGVEEGMPAGQGEFI